MLPESVTVPPVRPVTSTMSPAVVLVIVAAMVTLPVPPWMSTPMPPGSLVLPIEPPLIVTVRCCRRVDAVAGHAVERNRGGGEGAGDAGELDALLARAVEVTKRW